MRTVTQLRRQSRRTFWLSMAVAAAAHGVLLVVLLKPRPVAPGERVIRQEVEGTLDVIRLVDVHFGPPEIVRGDGTLLREPPERVLEAEAIDLLHVQLPDVCWQEPPRQLLPAEARIRLELNRAGRVRNAAVETGTGDACRDGMMTAIASSLWYHWLPDARYPAPVDLVQPMRVSEASNE